ncbi:MAG: phage portal protein [Faecalicatena sp.]|nr:phage portal protein [Faecalicatena sp.]MCI6466391.1 phage portal protein [Faecalicatena sp.]MCI7182362.1 phage portal protein [Lachnospiraceae bacterium]MDY5619015.1 phage portal protein [Lachnospiraceae bacterium]
MDKPSNNVLKMVTTLGEFYYAWNGKLYESDIVRACIRPKVKAIGKLVGKHIRDDPQTGLKINPDANIRFLLSEPNPFMTGQQMQEKVANQLCLNNNAFILIVRDENGKAMQLYPIPCIMAEAKYNDTGELFLKFQYRNGKTGTFKYSDIIHLRQDYNSDDIFGESPAPALAQMMEVLGTIDQGIIKAIKNSGVIRWLLTFSSSMRDEDIKKNVQKFVDNYLAVETDSFGAAGVDAKATVQRIEPKDYVPNASQTDRTIDRIYSFFNTNKKIVQSEYTEDEWTAYYEAEIEPVAIQLCQVYSVKLFTRKERGFGNRIVFEANNLQCASLTTKLAFQAMVDRGAMTPNEWRETMNMVPVEGGDEPIRRLDTQVVNMVGGIINKMNNENYAVMAGIITQLLGTVKGGKENEA